MEKKTGRSHSQPSAEMFHILLHGICNVLVDISKYLLKAENDYVMFGWFTVFRQTSTSFWWTYYISVQFLLTVNVIIHCAKRECQIVINV